jgi:hypothetical protein
MDDLQDYIPTPEQLGVAWSLAWHHGHEWAQAMAPAFADPNYGDEDLVYSLSAIAETTRAARVSYALPGIESPEAVDHHGGTATLEHITGSGRLYWAIWPDGSVRLVVYRPAGAFPGSFRRPEDDRGLWVLEAALGPAEKQGPPLNGSWGEYPQRKVWVWSKEGAYSRHWVALASAIQAVHKWDSGRVREEAREWIKQQEEMAEYIRRSNEEWRRAHEENATSAPPDAPGTT